MFKIQSAVVIAIIGITAAACTVQRSSEPIGEGAPAEGTAESSPKKGSANDQDDAGEGGSATPDGGATDSGEPTKDAASKDPPAKDPTEVSATCGNMAGVWAVEGTCGPDVCVITQNGCATAFECGDGARSYKGSVAGNTATYTGPTYLGITGTCTVGLGPRGFSGQCKVAGETCSVVAVRP